MLFLNHLLQLFLLWKILNEKIEEIVLSKEKCNKMAKNALKVSTGDAEEKIYKEIEKLVKNK